MSMQIMQIWQHSIAEREKKFSWIFYFHGVDTFDPLIMIRQKKTVTNGLDIAFTSYDLIYGPKITNSWFMF